MKRVVMIWLMNLFLSLGSWSKNNSNINNGKTIGKIAASAREQSLQTHIHRTVCRPHSQFSSNKMVKRKCTASSQVCCYLFKEQQVLVSNYSIDSPIMFRLFRRIIENNILLRYLRCHLEKSRAQTRHKANRNEIRMHGSANAQEGKSKEQWKRCAERNCCFLRF